MKYKLRKMTGDQAKEILQGLLKDLGGIDEGDLTTFELSVVRNCSTNAPSKRRGIEQRLIDIE